MTTIPKAPKGFWTCFWCWCFGTLHHTKAFRPDSEKPVLDTDGDPVCQECNNRYWSERAKAEKSVIQKGV